MNSYTTQQAQPQRVAPSQQQLPQKEEAEPVNKVEPKPVTTIEIKANCGKDCCLEVTTSTQYNKGSRQVTIKLEHGETTKVKVNHVNELHIKEVTK